MGSSVRYIAVVACFEQFVDDLNECCCVLAGTPIWYTDNHVQSNTILAATGENENVPKKDMNSQLGYAGEVTVLRPYTTAYVICCNRC